MKSPDESLNIDVMYCGGGYNRQLIEGRMTVDTAMKKFMPVQEVKISSGQSKIYLKKGLRNISYIRLRIWDQEDENIKGFLKVSLR